MSSSPTLSQRSPTLRQRSEFDAGYALRAVGALALLTMGVVHLQQYLAGYSEVPTIGVLFVLNFVGALVIGLVLLGPVERVAGRAGSILLATAGAAMAAVSIVFLVVSEHTAIFGFHEAGYRPVIDLALAAEALAVVALGGFVARRLAGER